MVISVNVIFEQALSTLSKRTRTSARSEPLEEALETFSVPAGASASRLYLNSLELFINDPFISHNGEQDTCDLVVLGSFFSLDAVQALECAMQSLLGYAASRVFHGNEVDLKTVTQVFCSFQ